MRTHNQSGFLKFRIPLLLLFLFLTITCHKTEKDNTVLPETVVTNDGTAFSEILGRPTNTTISINILFTQQAEVYWELGTTPGTYSTKTTTSNVTKDVPLDFDFTNLTTDTKYYYRTRYRLTGSSSFLAGPEYTFRTPRSTGSTFTFAVEADPHLDDNSDTASYTLTLKNILSKSPDFLLDLGDTFFSEKQAIKTLSEITRRHLLLRSYFDNTCHSVPLYLALGNHEGETGWASNGTSTSLAVMASNTRNLYYPNPAPNSFYSGNTKSESFVGLRKGYYAFEWGNAQIIVLDPYWYTTTKPGWGWTLGADQYNWFKNAITSSKAKYKFLFAHQLVGGSGNDARGGAEFVDFFEMGGNDLDGTPGFDKYRPGWGKPIHTLMKENKATIYFHGHDHFYGKQDKDGIVYQECPQPSNRSIANFSAKEYGYVNGTFLPGRGYLLVTVSGSSVKVDYIKTLLPAEEGANGKNGDIAASYTKYYVYNLEHKRKGLLAWNLFYEPTLHSWYYRSVFDRCILQKI
jgi:hypothetical protein